MSVILWKTKTTIDIKKTLEKRSIPKYRPYIVASNCLDPKHQIKAHEQFTATSNIHFMSIVLLKITTFKKMS
jgi:hypothetical protein